jgi:hypothetical protein
MANQTPDRPRIFSVLTRTRFLHLEDALTPAEPGKPGKIRLFIGSYTAGSGEPAVTAHHFLDDAEARVIFADMAWGKPVDITDYKGTVNNGGPQSRVLKIKGPTDKGKYWLQIGMGPGEVIGQGAVKPAGKPEVEVSIPLDVWEARRLALAVIEYMDAFRVAALLWQQGGLGDSPGHPGAGDRPQSVDPDTGEIATPTEQALRDMHEQDIEDLFGRDNVPLGYDEKGEPIGTDSTAAVTSSPAPCPQKANPDLPPDADPRFHPAPSEKPTDDSGPPAFYSLAKLAIEAGLLDTVNELVRAPGSWREKSERLQQAMAA